MMPNWAILWKANTVAIERMSTALYCPDGPFLTRLEKAVIRLYLNNFGKYVLDSWSLLKYCDLMKSQSRNYRLCYKLVSHFRQINDPVFNIWKCKVRKWLRDQQQRLGVGFKMHQTGEWPVGRRQWTGIANSRYFDNATNLAWTICRLLTEAVERIIVLFHTIPTLAKPLNLLKLPICYM